MRVECESVGHLPRPLVRLGMVARKGGGGLVQGTVHWCARCGAVRSVVDGEVGEWVMPGGVAAAGHLQAQVAAHG